MRRCKGGWGNVSKLGARKKEVRSETAPPLCGWSTRAVPTLSCLQEAISHVWGDLPNIVQRHSGDRDSVIQETEKRCPRASEGVCDLWGGKVGKMLSVCQETAEGHGVHIPSAISVYAEHQVGARHCPRA